MINPDIDICHTTPVLKIQRISKGEETRRSYKSEYEEFYSEIFSYKSVFF